MFLLAQLWLYLLLAAVLGVLIGVSLARRFWTVRTVAAARDLEFKHTEQLYTVSAEHDAALTALEAAQYEANVALEKTAHDAVGMQARISERDRQIKELSTMLMRVNSDLAKAEGVRRGLMVERQRHREELEALRKQVASARADLAQVLANHEREKSSLQEQLAAERAFRMQTASS
jgi:peptidoglycan hydrolase CwlO-like protein